MTGPRVIDKTSVEEVDLWMLARRSDVTMRDATPAGGAKRFRAGDEILGRYVVESELGQGGMGVVYRSLDKVGGVKVAVRVADGSAVGIRLSGRNDDGT